MWGELAFLPTLGYNLLRNYFQQSKWPWYSRIDSVVVLGGLPFKSMIEELVKEENVGGVVCCTEEFETRDRWAVDEEEWIRNGVKFHAIRMLDFYGTATRPQYRKAVAFIDEIAAEGKSVYVHCKAGRTRSVSVVMCYLMQKHDWLPNVAFAELKAKRPQVLLHEIQWRAANEYRRYLDKTSRSSSSPTPSTSSSEKP